MLNSEKTFDITFQPLFSIDISYDDLFNCENECEDMICRCRVIEHATVEDCRNISSTSFVIFQKRTGAEFKNKSKSYSPSKVEKYCISKLLDMHDAFNTSHYTPIIEDGYYGQEITGVEIDFDHKNLCEDVKTMLSFDDDVDKIFFILKKEYGHISEMLADVTDVEIKYFRLSLIKPGAGFGNSNYDKDYHRPVASMPVYGIMYNGIIVDGHHRYAELLKQQRDKKHNGNTKFPYIVLK